MTSLYTHLTLIELEAEQAALECALATARREAVLTELVHMAQEVGDYGVPAQNAYIGRRPGNCRNMLRDAGQPYPRSGCMVCGYGGLRGCPYEQTAKSIAYSADLIDAVKKAQADREYPGKQHIERLGQRNATLRGALASIISDPDCCEASKAIARGALGTPLADERGERG
jgi:hypothetical protein